ncbi:MAG TPA: hypothetical protein VG028_06905 [Terriglobia bacterium]|nr:hypothetical protein [Terriglobia bacterium]
MRDRRHRCLKLRDVRLQREGYLVAKAALHARAHGGQKPRGGGRHTETNRRAFGQSGSVFDDAQAQQHQPSREEGSAASCGRATRTSASSVDTGSVYLICAIAPNRAYLLNTPASRIASSNSAPRFAKNEVTAMRLGLSSPYNLHLQIGALS